MAHMERAYSGTSPFTEFAVDARPTCRYKGFEVYPFIYLFDPPREWHGRRSDRSYNASVLICQAGEEPSMEDSCIFRLEATPWDSVGVAKRVAVKMAEGIIDGFVPGQTLMAQ